MAPQAIVFTDNDELSYALIRIIKRGVQGQTSVVRSLSDGSLYIRKQFIKRAEDPRTMELTFCDRIPPSIAPAVERYFNEETAAPTIVYRFCNGGDLGDFTRRYGCTCRQCRCSVIPECLFWHLEKELLKTIAYIHSGWQHGVGTVPDWEPISHADIHLGQILLHWPENKTNALPQILLGDWALAHVFKNLDTKAGMWKRFQRRELKFFAETLEALSRYRAKNVQEGECPIHLYQRLWEEADENEEPHLASYIAERFIPIAEKKIRELQEVSFHDFRWTKPKTSNAIMTLGNDRKSAEETCKREFRKNKIRQPWIWVDVDHLPDIVVEEHDQGQEKPQDRRPAGKSKDERNRRDVVQIKKARRERDEPVVTSKISKSKVKSSRVEKRKTRKSKNRDNIKVKAESVSTNKHPVSNTKTSRYNLRRRRQTLQQNA